MLAATPRPPASAEVQSAPLSVHLPVRRSTQCEAPPRVLCLARRSRRCFPCRSPTLRPWIVDPGCARRPGRRPSWRGCGARASEAIEKAHAKADAYAGVLKRSRAEGLSLSGGASIRPIACSSWASPSGCRYPILSRNDEGDPWVALAESLYAARSSAYAFLRGPPTAACGRSRQAPSGTIDPTRPGPLRRDGSR